MTRDVVRLSRRLSWLLRHGAGEVGLAMDSAGWARIADVLDVLGITRSQLDRAVQANDKGRLVVAGRRLRACQGHSLRGMPVTVEGLEASWEALQPAESLWHGTKIAAIEGIAARGVLPGERSHVHLASHADSRVGKRGNVDFLLEISPAVLADEHIAVFRSPNGVLLIRHVPVAAITGLRATSKAGEPAADRARALLRLGRPDPDRL